MLLRSTTFRGEWPSGLHWQPGETRPLPDGLEAPIWLPLGLVVDSEDEDVPVPPVPPTDLTEGEE